MLANGVMAPFRAPSSCSPPFTSKNQLFSPDGFTDYELEWSTTPTEVQFDLYLQVERRGKIVLAGKRIYGDSSPPFRVRLQSFSVAPSKALGTKNYKQRTCYAIVNWRQKGYQSSPGAARRNSVCKATTAIHFTDNFDSNQRTQWQKSRKHVEELGFSSEEADRILAKSFGWSYSEYWGDEKQATIPDPETVSTSLGFMKELGADMTTLVTKFPESVGLTEQEIQASVGTLDSSWGITGKFLKNLLVRNPQVLGYNVDCKGDCMGQCTRCWVRF